MLMLRRAKRRTSPGIKPVAAPALLERGAQPRPVVPGSHESDCNETILAVYHRRMTEVTIKVDRAVRARLAVLAEEQGLSLRDLVAHLASTIATQQEIQQKREELQKKREESQAATVAYIREHLCPGLTDADIKAGEQFWREHEAKYFARAQAGGPTA